MCICGELSWTKTGITYLYHLSDKIKKQENYFKHLQKEVFGTINIFDKINSCPKIGI